MNTDTIGRAIHDGWWQFMLMNGWRLGSRNANAKTHPHMVHWELLDAESRNQDMHIAYALGRRHQDLNKITSEDIHEAWRECERRVDHPHNRPFAEVHALSAGEHWLQSILIRALIPTLEPSPGDDLIWEVSAITNVLNRMTEALRLNPGMLLGIWEMVDLKVAVDNAQNACIELQRAASVAHTLWLANVHPELLHQPKATDWIEHERGVRALLNPKELQAVLSDIDTTP